jgi:polyisoprenyl-phosphate glycosyltransferase
VVNRDEPLAQAAHRSGESRVAYSVVAPLFNESGNLQALVDRLRPVLGSLAGESWEIIFVDDGSKDDSWQVVQRLHQQDARVKGLRFSRNFGHHIALAAGLDVCRGQRVVTMDSDLQDQPEDLPKMVAKMDEGFDLVYAERVHRKHSAGKTLSSRLFLWLLNRGSRVPYPITGAVYRIMTRPFVAELCRLREHHRLFTGLTSWLGFRQAAAPVEHGQRHSGRTKYDLGRMLRLAADSVMSFSAKPLQLLTWLGGAASVLSLILVITLLVRLARSGSDVNGWWATMAVVALFGSATLLALGIIGQYLARIFEEQKARPLYVLREQLGTDGMRPE